MSSVVVAGDVSGSVTLSAPSAAGSVVVTLPSASGTMLTTATPFSNGQGPAFSVYNNAGQTLAQSTFTKIAFQVEEWDTNNNFDSTTNYRFTPTVAGYYQINAAMEWTTSQGSSECLFALYKNGSFYKYMVDIISPSYSMNGSALVYCNGSTDYIELYAYTASASTRVINQGSGYTWFQGFLARAA